MMRTPTAARSRKARSRHAPMMLVLRIVIAAALVVDAVVHLQLAPGYQQAAPGGIGQGTLFVIQSIVAILIAVYVLVRGSKLSYALAAMIAFAALFAVILYRYVDVPAIGPMPAMYEPIWYFEKTLTAVAEAIAGILAVIGFTMVGRRRR
ncbi:hypothetical protein [Arthrobacter monumenti]